MDRRTRASVLAATVAALVLLISGCAGDDDDDSGDDSGAAPGSAVEAPAAGGEADEEAARTGGDTPADQGRASSVLLQESHLIHTAQLSVEVEDVLDAVRTAERMTAGSGGRIENEQIVRGEAQRALHASMTLRVPPDSYEQTLTDLAELGELLDQNREAKDVTREVVDIESRIATQRESIGRVRALLSEATRLADVVTIEGELTRRQADLESLLAQQKALSEQVSLTTIAVTFVAPDEEAPDDDDGVDLGFAEGLTGGWNAFVTIVAVVLTVLGALLPFAVVGALAAWPVLWAVRYSRRRAAGAPQPPVSSQ